MKQRKTTLTKATSLPTNQENTNPPSIIENIQNDAVQIQEEQSDVQNKMTLTVSPYLQQYIQDGGHFTGVLVDYMDDENKWSAKQLVRDILQNFYDGNKAVRDELTLDGVNIDLKNDGIYIKGEGSFDYRLLLYFGASDKNKTIFGGGNGESKFTANIQLLRDHNCKKLVYRSQNWQLTFFIDKAPEGAYVEEVEGIFIQLEVFDEVIEGNSLFIETDNEDLQLCFSEHGKSMFYHSDLEEYKNPTIDGMNGGLKVIEGESGGVFLNGQRYAYDARTYGDEDDEEKDEYKAVPHFSFWTKSLPKDLTVTRDRAPLSRSDVEYHIIPHILEGVECVEDIVILLEELEFLYPDKIGDLFSIFDRIYSAVRINGWESDVKDLLTFPEDYVVSSGSNEVDKMIECTPIPGTYPRRYFKVCKQVLEKFGMRKPDRFFDDLTEKLEVEPTPEQEKRNNLLIRLAESMIQFDNDDIRKVMEAHNNEESHRFSRNPATKIHTLPIKLYAGKDRPDLGEYKEDFVWVSDDVVNGECFFAIALYLHELTHKLGGEYTRNFTNGLTGDIAFVARYAAMVEIMPPKERREKGYLLLSEVKEAWEADSLAKNAFASFDDFEEKIISYVCAMKNDTADKKYHTSKYAMELGDKFTDVMYRQFEGDASFETFLKVNKRLESDHRIRYIREHAWSKQKQNSSENAKKESQIQEQIQMLETIMRPFLDRLRNLQENYSESESKPTKSAKSNKKLKEIESLRKSLEPFNEQMKNLREQLPTEECESTLNRYYGDLVMESLYPDPFRSVYDHNRQVRLLDLQDMSDRVKVFVYHVLRKTVGKKPDDPENEVHYETLKKLFQFAKENMEDEEWRDFLDKQLHFVYEIGSRFQRKGWNPDGIVLYANMVYAEKVLG